MKSSFTDNVGTICVLLGLAMLSAAFLLLQLPLWVNLAVFGGVFLIVGCALLEDDETGDDDTDTPDF